MKNRNNYSNSDKTELKILFNLRGQYLYTRAKPRGITLKGCVCCIFASLKSKREHL